MSRSCCSLFVIWKKQSKSIFTKNYNNNRNIKKSNSNLLKKP